MSKIPRSWSNGTAAQRLVSTIEATGGLIEFGNGSIAPMVDWDWIDLADVYLKACAELKRKPLMTRATHED